MQDWDLVIESKRLYAILGASKCATRYPVKVQLWNSKHKSKHVSAKVALWGQRWRDDSLEVWVNWLRSLTTMNHRDIFCDTYLVQMNASSNQIYTILIWLFSEFPSENCDFQPLYRHSTRGLVFLQTAAYQEPYLSSLKSISCKLIK